MAITQKIEVGISSNLLHSISTSICIRKCNKYFLWFRSHFLEKLLYYSTVIFSDFGSFYKMAITQKIEVGISSNLLHSISTSICIRKCNKIFCDFGATFWKNHCTIVQWFFRFWLILQNGHNSKNWSWNQLKLATQHQYMYKKM